MSPSPSLVYFEHTPFCIGPVPVPLYLLTIQISLYSLFCYLCFFTLVSHLYHRLYKPIHAFTSRLSNASESLSSLNQYSSFPNIYCFGEPTSPKPPQAPQLLHKLWDLNLCNVKATPYVKLHVASPLLPPPPPPPGSIPYWELSHSRPPSTMIYNDPTLTFLASTAHTMQHSYVYWFPLPPSPTVNDLGTSLDLLGTPSRGSSCNSNYY
ncbi:hypothetical protein GG344DRAFT_82775 [Lentinula edodes]|nr:hypothetical protein GG344DRAFT_82775 [Lentinula edodes]